jgi:HlyD family secretion protein
MEEKREIEIRSDEVQEILSSVPSWMIRWGITLIFVIMMICIVLAYFIKYPDVIKGTISLTTVTPPSKLVSKTSGEIEGLFVKDNQYVKAGDVLARIKNPLTKEAVDFLEKIVLEVQTGLKNDFKSPIEFATNQTVFGGVQGDYNELVNAVNEYRFSLNTDQYEKRRQNLEKQISNYRRLDEINQRQFKYAEESYVRAEDKYKANKDLYAKNVISKADFFDQEAAFTQAKNELENLRKNNLQNTITLTDYERQLNELEIDFLTKKMNISQTIETRLNNIRNEINNWQAVYLITAPMDGRVNYLMRISENQFVEAGKQLFAVIPDGVDQYVGYIEVDKLGYGKVEVGQQVKIRLDNFPSAEYGQLKGVVQSISAIPNEDKYLIKVGLTNGLMSTYNKKLIYSPEMTGQADIVTKDLRIVERIFNQFRKLFDE